MNLESLSPRDIEDFKEHSVWQVILGDLNNMRDIIRDDLEEAPIDDVILPADKDGNVDTVRGVRKLQGAASILRHILALPDMMIAELKDMEDVKDERREEDND